MQELSNFGCLSGRAGGTPIGLERFYRDKDGNPQSGHSFTLTDIGLAQLALADAARWITENRRHASEKEAA